MAESGQAAAKQVANRSGQTGGRSSFWHSLTNSVRHPAG